MNYYSSIHISLGYSLCFSFYTSQAFPGWSNLIYWLKLLCTVSIYTAKISVLISKPMYPIIFWFSSSSGYPTDLFQNKSIVMSFPDLILKFYLAYFSYSYFLSLSKNCHPPFSGLRQTLGFHPLTCIHFFPSLAVMVSHQIASISLA